MENILLSIGVNDPLWIAIAFLFGLLVKLFGLPPLVGFLVAGFFLNFLGAQGSDFLSTIADMGITLLLFSIGLKLKLRALVRPEVLGVATVHMLFVTIGFGLFVFLFSLLGLQLFAKLNFQQAILIGFVLSFSSTVFAIKILDELGASASMHGKIAIGVLVIQDVAAVLFLAISSGKMPSPWALTLFLLIPLRPFLYCLIEKCGHGELLVLFGFVLALGGADLFELVGMKGDVGALVVGMLLASHPKASELSKSLLSFKDLFLVGFLLSIGLVALPGWQEVFVAFIFILLLPMKVAAYFGLFNVFKLRASTTWRSSLNLANYSEFGLIVGALAATYGWLPKEWLVVFAIALSFSFVLSAPLVSVRDSIYKRYAHRLRQWERNERIPGEHNLELGPISMAVFGMGRMGTAAYESMKRDFGEGIVGVDINLDKALSHQQQGRHVVAGDPTNPDFWIRAEGLIEGLRWVLLALPSQTANIDAIKRIKELDYTGKIAVTSRFDDEESALEEIGVDLIFNVYTEAGLGFASDLKAAGAYPDK